MNSQFKSTSILFLTLLIVFACKTNKESTEETSPTHVTTTLSTTTAPVLNSGTNVKGYNIFTKINGIWSGSLTSGTTLPSFPNWIVDFRPIHAAQVSAKNELDSINDIFMSLFIVLHNNEYKIAFRNGGGFAGMQRISYMVIDSVSETGTKSYYRFTDFVKGKKRVYASFDFHNDSLIVSTYTNKNNSLTQPVMHFIWRASLLDATSAAPAIQHFRFPKKELVKDFSHTFDGLSESIYYQAVDPYPETDHPYLSTLTISYSFAPSLTISNTKKVILLITTQPLISGVSYNPANLKYLSRYVSLPASDPNFKFNYMHPGTYYVYAIYDKDGNQTMSSGDYISSTNATFTVNEKTTVNQSVQINFIVP